MDDLSFLKYNFQKFNRFSFPQQEGYNAIPDETSKRRRWLGKWVAAYESFMIWIKNFVNSNQGLIIIRNQTFPSINSWNNLEFLNLKVEMVLKWLHVKPINSHRTNQNDSSKLLRSSFITYFYLVIKLHDYCLLKLNILTNTYKM